MLIYIAVLVTLGVLLLFVVFGVLTNILMAIHSLERATRETPILTRSSSQRSTH